MNEKAFLNVYSALDSDHTPAIIGTREGFMALKRALDRIVSNKSDFECFDIFTSDNLDSNLSLSVKPLQEFMRYEKPYIKSQGQPRKRGDHV